MAVKFARMRRSSGAPAAINPAQVTLVEDFLSERPDRGAVIRFSDGREVQVMETLAEATELLDAASEGRVL